MLHRLPILRHFRARPRLLASIALMAVAYFLLPEVWRGVTRGLVAWNAGVMLDVILSLFMIRHCSEEDHIRRRATDLDEGRYVFLLITISAAVASLVAIAAELSGSKDAHPTTPQMALAGATVLLSWIYLHGKFGFHYAHEYFREGKKGIAKGLEFPGGETPDYWDFLYFSYIIGTSGQTADVGIASKPLRRLSILHCVLAFFFNATVLAFSVNLGASLLQGS